MHADIFNGLHLNAHKDLGCTTLWSTLVERGKERYWAHVKSNLELLQSEQKTKKSSICMYYVAYQVG